MVNERGYTLMEVMVMMVVFGAVLAIFFVLTAEMRKWEKRLPVNYMRHPQVTAVIARMRRDVLDAVVAGTGPYKSKFEGFKNDEKTLIVDTLIMPTKTIQTIVWDFNQPGVVRRYAYTSTMLTDRWTARGLPPDFNRLEVDAVKFPGRPWGVRIRASDENGRVSIDQILQPRAYAEPPKP